jgi:hypothetical protein
VSDILLVLLLSLIISITNVSKYGVLSDTFLLTLLFGLFSVFSVLLTIELLDESRLLNSWKNSLDDEVLFLISYLQTGHIQWDENQVFNSSVLKIWPQYLIIVTISSSPNVSKEIGHVLFLGSSISEKIIRLVAVSICACVGYTSTGVKKFCKILEKFVF